MLMVILGAGASFDLMNHLRPHQDITGGGQRSGFRPPITDELFSGRFRKTMDLFPEFSPIAPKLLTAVERSLQMFQAETHYLERRKQLMAIRHYVPRVVGDCEERWLAQHSHRTNHLGLLDAICSWCVLRGERACFVTFNYDTLIEQAFADSPLRLRMEMIEDYIKDDTYKVVKLHGSVTWFREISSPVIDEVENRKADDITRELIERAKDLVWEKGKFRIGKRNAIGKATDSGPAIVPAIAIAVQQRSEARFDECPPEHVKALEKCVPAVTKLMLIGWAGKETAFVEMLKSLPKGTDTIVVGGNQDGAETIARDFRKVIPTISVNASAARGFSEFVGENKVEEFLYREGP